MVKGNIFFRDLQAQVSDRKLFVFLGELWVPDSVIIKPEHLYLAVGSQYSNEGTDILGIGIPLNGEKDISRDTRKKNLSQIVPILHKYNT